MFTSPLELSPFCAGFKRGALRALAAPILGCTRLRSYLGKYPNVVIRLLFNYDVEVRNEGVQNCSELNNPSGNQLYPATALDCLTR